MFEKLASIVGGFFLTIAGFFGVTPESTPTVPVSEPSAEEFGAFSPAAGGTYRLKSSIGTTDTSITLSSFTEPITGNAITMTTLDSDIGYATIDPQSASRKEFISFTGITQNGDGSATLTGVSRGLAFQSPFTASTTLRKAHPGQSILILSDSPQLFSEYARRRSNETITGVWTFTNFPITASSSFASATTSGWVELATGGEAASSTLVGDISQSYLALHTGIATSSAPTSGNVVVVTGDDGNIDAGFIPSLVGSTTIWATTTTGTWIKPSNLKHIIVECQGAGGDGATDGAGGGGGGYVKKLLLASALSSTETVTVGTAGIGSGNTSFGSHVSCGNGADASGTSGGSGGSASGGDVNIAGAAGVGSAGNNGGGSGGGSFMGDGGHSPYNAITTSVLNGSPGSGYGGGGAGGQRATDGDPTGGTGGAGTTGIVVVTQVF